MKNEGYLSKDIEYSGIVLLVIYFMLITFISFIKKATPLNFFDIDG